VIVCVSGRKVDHPFTYRVPPEFSESLREGALLRVPFRRRSLPGYVVGLSNMPGDFSGEVLPIGEILDPELFSGAEMLPLAKWMSDYYCATFIESLNSILPRPVRTALTRKRKKAAPLSPAAPAEEITRRIPPEDLLPEEDIPFLTEIRDSIEGKKFKTFLLHRSSADKRMALYRRAIRICLETGREAIFLAPESSLLPDLLPALPLHSALPPRERFERWLRIRSGEVKVVSGTRSAVFAPLKNIGLIILEEEQDPGYKQENAPRYHARQVAFRRARHHGAAVLLGSASPSVESYYAAGKGIFSTGGPGGEKVRPPEVVVVDLREEWKRKSRGLLGGTLIRRIRETLDRGGQAALFINRKGFSSSLQCPDCGFTFRCPRCSISLSFHRTGRHLTCRYCAHSQEAPDTCPSCASFSFRTPGSGTQKIMESFSALFPGVPATRWDGDLSGDEAARKGFEDFVRGDCRVLIGTQGACRLPGFPRVELAAMLFADPSLNFSDFRAGERTYQLLNMIMGLAPENGRGLFLIQTCSPEHPALRAVATGREKLFYNTEILSRKELGYPPFKHLARVLLSGPDEKEVEKAAFLLAGKIAGAGLGPKTDILGPAPCPLPKLRSKSRWHLLLRSGRIDAAVRVLRGALWDLHLAGISVGVDVDPLDLI
jgi:primosomal protein N' (replication factor Y)